MRSNRVIADQVHQTRFLAYQPKSAPLFYLKHDRPERRSLLRNKPKVHGIEDVATYHKNSGHPNRMLAQFTDLRII